MISPFKELQAACVSARQNEPLAKHSSFAIGGPAEFYADVNTRAELQALRRVVLEQKLPVFFLGAGSNLLIADTGVRGLVIHLQGDFRKIAFDGEHVTVGAGAWMPVLAKQSAEHGLAGVESLIGVPGTVGGGLVMNAGTREGWLGTVVESIEFLDEHGEFSSMSAADAQFSYRHSNLEGRWITGATLRLKPEDSKAIVARVDSYLQYRSRTQPLATNNCGSVFKNPEGHAAAKLVEAAGLKGQAVGSARVSERHANFIINEGGATAKDVRTLIQSIQNTVLAQFKIHLEPEVKFAGDWPKS